MELHVIDSINDGTWFKRHKYIIRHAFKLLKDVCCQMYCMNITSNGHLGASSAISVHNYIETMETSPMDGGDADIQFHTH
jgi:hypothetical protein